MKQVWISKIGEPSVLEVREAPDPEAGDGEVRIRVAAAGINFADIVARIGLYPDAPKPQHGTVQRLLQRLSAKGFVVRDRSLGISVFSPAISRDAYASAQLESLANRLTQGSLAPMITRLVADNKLSHAEIERLRRILEGEA